MDKRIPELNNPIPLHFYEVTEKLPDDESYKIVVYKSPVTKNGIDFAIAYYDSAYGKKWETDHLYELTGVIAWASFSPEWVLGVDL